MAARYAELSLDFADKTREWQLASYNDNIDNKVEKNEV